MADLLEDALEHLMAAGYSLYDAIKLVPAAPGLYAIHGSPVIWEQLRLGTPPDARPLYIGKAERSLLGRDVRQHFATGKTGSSTVRRSLAALLSTQLALTAQPRNIRKPDGSANYGLEAAGDQRLSDWMADHLRLSVWAAPTGTVLEATEKGAFRKVNPPLNLRDLDTPWTNQVMAARRVLAAQSRANNPVNP